MESKTRAVQVTIDNLIREAKLEQLRQLKGKVSILDNEEIEAENDAHFSRPSRHLSDEA